MVFRFQFYGLIVLENLMAQKTHEISFFFRVFSVYTHTGDVDVTQYCVNVTMSRESFNSFCADF